jgi:hypothetical protein
MPEQTWDDKLRLFILDSQIEENVLDMMDYRFSPEEIANAKSMVRMQYNEEILPIGVDVLNEATELPAMPMFFHGVVYYLYLGEVSKLASNRVEFQAGNMESDPYKARIEYMAQASRAHKEEFMRAAKQRKVAINSDQAYGTY